MTDLYASSRGGRLAVVVALIGLPLGAHALRPALPGVTRVLTSPRTTPGVRVSATTADEDCLALDSSDELGAKWGVCVAPESQTFKFNSVDENFEVDKLECTIVKDPGLGIELTEVANNGEGVGVVIVSGLVPGSPAASSPLQPGDVISKVGTVDVEAKTYDDLVDVLVAADPVVKLTVKRLIQRFKVRASIRYANDAAPGKDGEIFFGGENLRRGLIARGVKVNDSSLGKSCGGDGQCQTCAVEVLGGANALTQPKGPEKIIFRNAPTWRLSCQTSVRDLPGFDPFKDDLVVRIYPHRQNNDEAGEK
eukprot:CAMPEP_0185720720 /NCGR_PEP_ID=MMETSP1164-20130828/50257_1 /TAXON_ID=1104430 /ORGANISM="Chrysoreinhardia sp, Strain CCMP2950" /LENGTH=307 /DNA_ID=CAMNT_0028388383 /DNA_START=5 /DNA_END=928 /DNA_ORIENTATION=-